MRDAKKPATLGELRGGQGQMTLANLHEFLGDKMPNIPVSKVGRIRLINALQERFGANFRNMPGVDDVLNEFDGKLDDATIVAKNMEGRHG